MSKLSVVIGNVDDIHGQIVGWSLGRRFARMQTAPGFMALMDDLQCVFLVFGFSGEGKSIFWLAIRDLVDPKKTNISLTPYVFDGEKD